MLMLRSLARSSNCSVLLLFLCLVPAFCQLVDVNGLILLMMNLHAEVAVVNHREALVVVKQVRRSVRELMKEAV